MIDRPVGDILKGKASASLFSVTVTAIVAEAVALMDEKGLGSVLVRDATGSIAGDLYRTRPDAARRAPGPGCQGHAHVGGHVPRRAQGAGDRVDRGGASHHGRARLPAHDGERRRQARRRGLDPRPHALVILPDAPIAHEGRRGEVHERAKDTVETLRQQ